MKGLGGRLGRRGQAVGSVLVLLKVFLLLLPPSPLPAEKAHNKTVIIGMRLEGTNKQRATFVKEGIIQVIEGSDIQLRIFGQGIHSRTWEIIYFAVVPASGAGDLNAVCREDTNDLVVESFIKVPRDSSALLNVKVQTLRKKTHVKNYTMCLKNDLGQPRQQQFRDNDLLLQVVEEPYEMPLWLLITLIVSLLTLINSTCIQVGQKGTGHNSSLQ